MQGQWCNRERSHVPLLLKRALDEEGAEESRVGDISLSPHIPKCLRKVARRNLEDKQLFEQDPTSFCIVCGQRDGTLRRTCQDPACDCRVHDCCMDEARSGACALQCAYCQKKMATVVED
jgi:hypothetical protein